MTSQCIKCILKQQNSYFGKMTNKIANVHYTSTTSEIYHELGGTRTVFCRPILIISQTDVGRLLHPDIVHFHFTCLGTEIFLRERILSSMLSSNLKSFHFIDLYFFHKLLFYLHKFYDKFFYCSMAEMNEDTRFCYSKVSMCINQSSF